MAARKKIAKGTRRVVYERDDWTCRTCGRRMPPQNEDEKTGSLAPFQVDGPGVYVWLELDHITPICAGGTNAPENLRALCSPCNRTKSHSTAMATWEARIERAKRVLASYPPSEGVARMAAAALLGGEEVA